MRPSAIGWCDCSGGALNFVRGCTKVSEGCQNCFAEAIYKRFGKDFSKVICDRSALEKLTTMQVPKFSPKRGAPHKPICFVCDTGDLGHEAIPPEFVQAAFDVMARRGNVNWVVLTKRIEHLCAALFSESSEWCMRRGVSFPNIRLMVTAENQARFDERVPILLDCWNGPTGVCVEPMLEPVDMCGHLFDWTPPQEYYVTHDMAMDAGDPSMEGALYERRDPECLGPSGKIGWVICGAESGPHRRPFQREWALDLYEQCKAAGVPFWGKQSSAFYPGVPLVLPGYGVVNEWPGEW